MKLEELEDLFENLDIDSPNKEQLYHIYGIYLRDFVNSELEYEGKKVLVNKALVKDKREGCFLNKQKTFDHIVTRKSQFTNKRKFDKDRANKIHWIKCIIENSTNALIKKYEVIKDAKKSIILWLQSKKYVVILREEEPNVLLVTGYCVDQTEEARFNSEYKQYINKKTPLRK
jgi:hypothetical protein